MSLIELRDRALEIAVGEIGVRETAPNRGPRIARYQQAAGISPGDPWCMAFVVWCYDQAAMQLGMPFPLPRTGKVARFFRRCDSLWRSKFPSVGAIYGHLEHPDDPESKGHCGIVLRPFETDGGLSGVEGNSNARGSREGDGVVVNPRSLLYANQGFVDIGIFGPPATPPAVA